MGMNSFMNKTNLLLIILIATVICVGTGVCLSNMMNKEKVVVINKTVNNTTNKTINNTADQVNKNTNNGNNSEELRKAREDAFNSGRSYQSYLDSRNNKPTPSPSPSPVNSTVKNILWK